MEFCLQYLDRDGQHLDVDYFNKLREAMDRAAAAKWAYAFNLQGMGQLLHAKRNEDGTLTDDDWQGGIARFGNDNTPSQPLAFIVG